MRKAKLEYEELLKKLTQENHQLKESLISKELELKNKEEDVKFIEEEYQQKLDESAQEHNTRILELEQQIKMITKEKQEYANKLEQVGVNPLSLKKFEIPEEEIERQKQQALAFQVCIFLLNLTLLDEIERI